jgi:hypothetical protein
MAKKEEIISPELFDGNRPTRLVEELDLDHVGCEHFDDGADVPRKQAELRSIVQEGHDVEHLDRRTTHTNLIPRSR